MIPRLMYFNREFMFRIADIQEVDTPAFPALRILHKVNRPHDLFRWQPGIQAPAKHPDGAFLHIFHGLRRQMLSCESHRSEPACPRLIPYLSIHEGLMYIPSGSRYSYFHSTASAGTMGAG